MLRERKTSVRRLSLAAVLAVGTLAPLVAAGAAEAAPGTSAVAAALSAPAPVNGPLVFATDAGTTLHTRYADGSKPGTLDTTRSCDTEHFVHFDTWPTAGIAYSPDGTKAVVGCGPRGLTLTNADLARPFPLFVPKTSTGGAGTGAVDPVWAPDGKTVYFTWRVPTATGLSSTAWSVRADGSGAAPVAGIPAETRVTSVAPDGALLLVADNGGSSTISILDPGKTAPRVLETKAYNTARFSPDGTKVAFAHMQQGTASINIAVTARDGSGTPVELSHSVSSNVPPENLVWSPDGKLVAFTQLISQQPTWAYQLFSAPADGSAAPTPIGDPAPVIHLFAWHDGAIPATPRPNVTRLAGNDRIGTAIAVADAGYDPSRAGTTKAAVAVLSRQDAFADALPGNALAAQKHGPLLLTGSAKLDPEVGRELTKVLAKGATVYVLGGDQALSPQVETDLRALGLAPKRLAGTDRFETATKIAAEVSQHPHTVLVATGINFPDALAAGAAAATDPAGGVVLLSNDKVLPASTKAYLSGVSPASTAVYGVGRQGVAALKTLPAFENHFTELAGDDRYSTDLAVASNTALFPAAPDRTFGIATGTNWPDALSGGAYVGALHSPLLLVNGTGDGFSAGTAAQWVFGRHSWISQLAVFGGPAAVHQDLLTKFGSYAFGTGNFDVR